MREYVVKVQIKGVDERVKLVTEDADRAALAAFILHGDVNPRSLAPIGDILNRARAYTTVEEI